MSRAVAALILAATLLSGPASAEPTFVGVKAKSGYFRTSDGVRLHYLELGRGPAIVFVPGWTVPAWSWDPQIRHFSKEHRVIALDPRSQGKSGQSSEGNYPERRARDIKELIDKLKLAPAILVGHSLAVTELLVYADQFGTNTLAGLVLVDQDFGPYPTPEEIGRFFAFLHEVSQNRKQTLDQMAASFFKKPPPPGYVRRLVSDCMKTPTNTAVALIVSRFGMDLRPTVAKLDIPVLYAITPDYRETGEWLRKTLPNAKVEVFEDAGHVIFMDEADRFNSLVYRFARAAFERRHTPG